MFDSILFIIAGIVLLSAGIYQQRLNKKINENRSDLLPNQRRRLKKISSFVGNLEIVVGFASVLSGGIMFLKYCVS